MDPQKINRSFRRRLIALVTAVAVIFGIYGLRVFRIQIVEGAYYASLINRNKKVVLPLKAARGEILDRAMRPMAVNATAYEVLIDGNYFPYGTSAAKRGAQNDILLKLTELLEGCGESWRDTLPLTSEEPFAFLPERDSSAASLKKKLRLADYATAENCMDALIKQYRLEEYTPSEQRRLAGIQMQMTLDEFGYESPYVLASGVAKDTTYLIEENADRFPGINIQSTAVRSIQSGTIAAHLIGTVGPIYPEETAALVEKGYSLDESVGKSGIELAYESVLRGKSGSSIIIKNSSNTVIDAYTTVEPVPGQTVILTIDSYLQEVADKAIDTKLRQLRAQPKVEGNGYDIVSGSAVMIDVKTGGVLVCSSWPTFNLETYQKDYSKLIADPDKPLYNRALYGAYPCGSTMKPCVALAALNEGIITAVKKITCTGTYRFYDPPSKCLHNHGSLTVTQALARSCNVFFYDTGRLLGIEKMNEYSKKLGLGQKTGIEIGESAGILAGPEYVSSIGETWLPGYTIQAAIGQAQNAFTPIQLATYCAAIANDGVRYKTHLMQALRSHDGTETLYEPEIMATLDLSDYAIQTVKQGMEMAAKSGGTAYSMFRTASYTVAAKTGTAQTGIKGRSDHGVFIAYAPAENPEVAIAVMMEQGGGRNASTVARQVFDAYFATKSTGITPTPQGQLVG